MQNFSIGDKPAFKINAKKLVEKDKAILFDCEGDKVWLPKSQIKILPSDTILVVDWIYKQKFK